MKQYANQRSKVFRNSKRMNRLEELGRVDAEKAKTRMGKRNLKDEKKRIVRELKAKGGTAGTTLKYKKKKFGVFGDSKKTQKKYYDSTRAASRDMNKTGKGKQFRDATRVDKQTGQIKLKKRAKKADGGSLKPVKPSQKGLKKLPTKVRNKMGYMKKGGRVGMGKAMRGGGCVR